VNFSVQKNESHTCIRVLDRNLDANVAPQLKSELAVRIGKGDKNILVDLSDCRQCDSSGLSALLLGNRLCESVHGKFVLCCLSAEIRDKLELARIDSAMLTADSRIQAEHFFRDGN
jgi:anti-anti-sigma factor